MYWSQLKIWSVAPCSGLSPDAIGFPFSGSVTGFEGRASCTAAGPPLLGFVGFVHAAMIAARVGMLTAAPAPRRSSSRLVSRADFHPSRGCLIRPLLLCR